MVNVCAQGYPDIKIDHFMESLSNLVNKVYRRDPSDLMKDLAANVAASAVANQVRKVEWLKEPYIPNKRDLLIFRTKGTRAPNFPAKEPHNHTAYLIPINNIKEP